MNNLKVNAITSFKGKLFSRQKQNTSLNPLEDKNRTNGKKIALTLVGLGALAVAGVAIAGKIRKKGLDGSDVERIIPSGDDEKLVENITKFFNSKGEEVSNVEFDKGVAKIEDGFFTGTLQRIIGDKEINVEYVEGRARSTVIDGILKKEFYYTFGPNDVLDKIYISKFDENGQKISERTNVFDSDGFLIRTLLEKPSSENEKAAEVIDFRRLDNIRKQGFTPEQAKKAIISGKINYSDIEYGKVEKVQLFDYEGNVAQVLQPSSHYSDGSYFEIVEKMPDGTRKITDTWNNGVTGDLEAVSAQEIIDDMSNPAVIKRISYKDTEGKLTKDIEFGYDGSFTRTLYDSSGKEITCFSLTTPVQDKPFSFDLIKEDETAIWAGYYPQAKNAEGKTFALVQEAGEAQRDAAKTEIQEVFRAYNAALKDITDEGLLSKIDIRKISDAIRAIAKLKK